MMVEADLNLSMFRAYDIRTPSSLLTPELAERLARAEAVYIREVLGAPGVVVAHDARRTGPQYLTITIDAFRERGAGRDLSSRGLLDVLFLLCGDASSAACRDHRRRLAQSVRRHGPEDPRSGRSAHRPGNRSGRWSRPASRNCTEPASRSPGRERGRLRAEDLMEDFVNYSMELAGVGPGSLQGASVSSRTTSTVLRAAR